MQFSRIELAHLGKAWFAITLAFAIMLGGLFSPNFIAYFIISAIAVGSGFLLHEMAHKFFAQRNQCWAEFRADNKMLVLAIVFSFFGFIFAAPGAVMISGKVNKKLNGIISLAGPATNIVLALVFLYIATLGGFFEVLGSFGHQINLWLGIFNMIPFGFFDGAKVFQWNKLIYFITIAIMIALFWV